MKAPSASDTAQQRASWRPFIGALLTTMTSAITVLGAILLSLQSQVQGGQSVVRAPEEMTVEVIPTAMLVTFPPATAVPTLPGPALEITVTATPPGATTISFTPTPWPCAGGAPWYWELYVVPRGATLFSLARRHGTTVQEVIYRNCLVSDQVWAGQRLYLPPLPTPVPTTAPPPTPSSTPTAPPPPPPATPTLTATPSPPSVTTATPTAGATATPTISPTAIISPTARPTLPPEPSATITVTATALPSLTPTAVISPTPSTVPSPSPTLTPSATPTPSPRLTAEPTVVPTLTPTETLSSVISTILPFL